MAIIDFIEWKPQGDEMIYAYHYPETNLSTYSQLVVQESQEALLFSKGQLMKKFSPGKHTLNTENIPVLRSLFGIPFGGKNPFTAEVWFVNKVQTFAIDWKISKMAIHDVDYQTQLPLTACGQYGLKIIDSEKFLIKFVGSKYVFSQSDMTEQSYGEFCSKAKSNILQFMIANHIGYKQISAFLDPISENIRTQMQDFWSQLGLELTKFYVTSIEIDTSTDEGARVSEAIAQQASMSITGHTWQQEQMFSTANNAIGGMAGMSGTGGLLGGLMAMQMMNGMAGAGVGGGMMSPQYNQPNFASNNGHHEVANMVQQPAPPVHEVYCANCSKKIRTDQLFCPHCGKKYNPCPKCGSDNAENAKRCVSCGNSLVIANTEGGAVCPKCGAQLSFGMQFCGNCGTRVAVNDDNVCSRCGAKLPPHSKFCPKCGLRRD